jgi:hypothetical protein
MSTVHFAPALQRHVECPSEAIDAATVHEALDAYFARHPSVRGYVLDEQGALRRHVAVFVGGDQIVDRRSMTDPLGPDSELYVMQALSGG